MVKLDFLNIKYDGDGDDKVVLAFSLMLIWVPDRVAQAEPTKAMPFPRPEIFGTLGNVTCAAVRYRSPFPPVLSFMDAVHPLVICSDVLVETFHAPDNLEMYSQIYEGHFWFCQLNHSAQIMLRFDVVVVKLC